MVRTRPDLQIVRPGALDQLGHVVDVMGGSPLVVSGPTASRDIASEFNRPDVVITASTQDQLEKLVSLCRDDTLIVAIGGGKVIDVAKMAGHQKNLSVISVPTVLSGDGIASPVAVIDGISHKTSVPAALVCDISIISGAPEKWNAAGAGDLLSNLSSTHDWRNSGDPEYNPKACMFARQGALELLRTLEMGLDFLSVLARGLALSGAAMAMAGSSKPASGSEHKISHAIDRLFPASALHGQQVALASVFTTYLQSNPLRSRMISAFKKVGLPLLPGDIGLSPEDFAACVQMAPSTRPDRTTILEKTPLEMDRILGLVREAFGL